MPEITKLNPKSPCYGCKERHEGCHSECERYRKWADNKKRINAKKFEEWSAMTYGIDRITRIQKMRERKKIK
jgi:hypothetical protein